MEVWKLSVDSNFSSTGEKMALLEATHPADESTELSGAWPFLLWDLISSLVHHNHSSLPPPSGPV